MPCQMPHLQTWMMDDQVVVDIIMVVGKEKKCVLAWVSKKIKRVVRSTLAAEMLNLAEALEHAVYLRHIMMELLGLTENIGIHGIVDNQSIVDALHSTKAVDDKRRRQTSMHRHR